MMKAELVGAIAKEANISKASAEKALNALTSSVTSPDWSGYMKLRREKNLRYQARSLFQ